MTDTSTRTRDPENTTSDQRVLSVLYRMIIDGKLKPGDKITEVQIANMLNVSRTPARLALRTLEVEGRIKKRAGRGFTVQDVHLDDVTDAYDVRGVLEGLAAGVMAKKGASEDLINRLKTLVDEIDDILYRERPTIEIVDEYQAKNAAFHRTIMEECGNTYVNYAFTRLETLPMMKLGMVVFNKDKAERELMRLRLGNMQHRLIVDAIERRDAQRAESLMREHVNQTILYSEVLSS